MDLTRDALKFIQDSKDTKIIPVNGRQYADGSLSLISGPQCGTIKVTTLSGLVQILRAEKDKFAGPLIVHVEDHRTVSVHTSLDGDRNREEPFEAAATLPRLTLNDYIDVEGMIIQLKSRFVPTDDRETLVQLIGNITESAVRETGDDGFSQAVTTRKGIGMKQDAKVPSIVSLAPFRTFTEIQQPVSDFLVRVHDGPKVALFEADGGAWVKTAMDGIKDYLDRELAAEDGIIVIA